MTQKRQYKSCKQCSRRYYRKPQITDDEWAKRKYCSMDCKWEAQKTVRPTIRQQNNYRCYRTSGGPQGELGVTITLPAWPELSIDTQEGRA